MPKRQHIQHVLSDKVQGKGSWVDFRRMTVGEAKAVRAAAKEHSDPEREDENEAWAQENSTALMQSHIIDWNWIDEDGNPLPLPSDDATVIDRLTDLELEFLNNLFKPPTDPNG